MGLISMRAIPLPDKPQGGFAPDLALPCYQVQGKVERHISGNPIMGRDRIFAAAGGVADIDGGTHCNGLRH